MRVRTLYIGFENICRSKIFGVLSLQSLYTKEIQTKI